MKIAFIHFSDIHLKESDDENYVFLKVESIIRALNSDLYQADKTFIIVTGDIAFSGKASEFQKGMDLLTRIRNDISNKNTEFMIIAGNHDCDFSGDQQMRDLLKNRMSEKDMYMDEFVENISKPLTNFYDFKNKIRKKENIYYTDLLFDQYRFEEDTVSIQINCLNTAALSAKNENPGSLLYPINKYKGYMQNPATISITLLHHPTHWISPNNKREVDSILQANSDIILTGHEHTNTYNKNADLNGEETLYFEASALQTNIKDESSFSIFHIDTETESLTLNDFKWNLEKKMYISTKRVNIDDIKLSKTLLKNGYYFKEDYENWLNEPGIMIKHPRVKDKLLLGDIYVYPDAEKLNFEEKDQDIQTEIINLKSLLSHERKKVMIIGSENYGKTAFCKQYILNSLKKGFIPVLINGERFNKTSIDAIRKNIMAEFTKQYGETKKDEFSQVDLSQIILVIDDIHKSPLNAKHRNKLLNEINYHYPNVLITSDEFIKYEELLADVDEATYKDDFFFIEILPLGNSLRGDLVRIWNELGIEQNIEDEQIVKRMDKCEDILKTMIGNNYIPSLPFFILTILQTIESGDTNLKDSAYGYYYEYLIKNQLINIKMSNEEMNTFNNYIAQLSFAYFDQEINFMTKTELSEFDKLYTNEYAVTSKFEAYLKILLDTSILSKTGASYSFKYKYVYYYFVAKYLSDNITEKKIEELIVKMCSKLYIEEYSNIIMFLTHLSKNPIILHNVLENAKNIFNNYKPAELGADIEPLNKLVVNLPDLVVDNRNVLAERKRRQEQLDEYDRQNAHVHMDQIPEYEHKDETEFDLVANLNWATKTIEILGQILKNYYGMTKRDAKLLMTKELYELSLRSLGAFLVTLVEYQDNILHDIERIIKKNNISESDEKIQNLARNFIFGLSSTICFSFIKKVSNAVGSNDLQPIFKEISAAIPTTSVRLIDITIKLDHAYEIPFSEIEDLLKVIDSNPMVKYILRKIVINHLYMFPVNYKDRQRIVDLLSMDQKRVAIGTVKNNLIEK